MSNPDGLKVCVDEMNRNLRLQYEGVDVLKATARSILSAASLVSGLMGVLQLARPVVEADYLGWYNLGIVVAVALYVALIVVCVISIIGIKMFAPVAADWNTLKTTFAVKTGDDLLDLQISALLNALTHNQPIIDRQNRLTLIACVLLPLIIIVLFALSLVPRA